MATGGLVNDEVDSEEVIDVRIAGPNDSGDSIRVRYEMTTAPSGVYSMSWTKGHEKQRLRNEQQSLVYHFSS